jgi:hypothetical protein
MVGVYKGSFSSDKIKWIASIVKIKCHALHGCDSEQLLSYLLGEIYDMIYLLTAIG